MIPAHYQAFIDNALATLKKDGRIAGLALTGSYVTGDMDAYSDLDFMVFVAPGHFDQVLKDRKAIIEKLGGLLAAFTGDHIGVPDLMICLFEAPLIHADFNFLPLETAEKRVYHTALLFDRDGSLEKALGTAEVFERGLDLQWLEDRFWVWVHYTALKIGRGELFEAIDAVTFIRATVLGPLLHVKKGGSPWGVRRLEKLAPEYMEKLIKTVPMYDAGSVFGALKEEIALYRELRMPYADDINRRDKAETAAENYLNEIAGLFSFSC